jgi:hypothetical protein
MGACMNSNLCATKVGWYPNKPLSVTINKKACIVDALT